MANYVKIKNFDVANGEGLGVSVYFAGCDKEPKCKGCFNCEAWNFDAGQPFDNNALLNIYKKMRNSHINHIAILGGEPLASNNIEEVFHLCRSIKWLYPDKKIWLWTHYKFEDLAHTYFPMLQYVDVLVDGEYIEEQRDLTLKWRGSKNQRVIDVQETLLNKKVVLYCE